MAETKTKTADDPNVEAARQRIADSKEIVEQSRAEYADRMKGKPTPTQEENDLAAEGAHILEHEHDGSDPDPHVEARTARSKTSEAKKPATQGSYQTRQAAPTPPRPPSSSS
jgi:hypothetical protein